MRQNENIASSSTKFHGKLCFVVYNAVCYDIYMKGMNLCCVCINRRHHDHRQAKTGEHTQNFYMKDGFVRFMLFNGMGTMDLVVGLILFLFIAVKKTDFLCKIKKEKLQVLIIF